MNLARQTGSIEPPAMVVCVPVTRDELVDPRWGRAERVAVAAGSASGIESWSEFDVGWGSLRESGSEGSHHARIARFLLDHRVDAVTADHMGREMEHMLAKMGIAVRLGASGRARDAVLAVLAG